MSKARKCDKCGAFYEPYKTDTIILTNSVPSMDGLDLCPDCMDTLKKWLKGQVQMIVFDDSNDGSSCPEEREEA